MHKYFLLPFKVIGYNGGGAISQHRGFEICLYHCFALEVGIAVVPAYDDIDNYFWGYCAGGTFDIGGNVYVGFGFWPSLDNIPVYSYASGVGGDVNILGAEFGIGFSLVTDTGLTEILGVIVAVNVGVGVSPVSATLLASCYTMMIYS